MTDSNKAPVQIGEDIVDRLVNEKEVCATLKFSARTLRRQVEAGKFPKPVEPSPGTRRWFASWLNKAVLELREQAESAAA